VGEVLGIIALTVVVPIALIGHFVTKWKAMKQITPQDEVLLNSLRAEAERLEKRLQALETILDDEVPNWRRRGHDPL
jgi:phage shock protein B